MDIQVGQTAVAQLAEKRSLRMPFTLKEQQALLALKGVGPTVLARLEQMGFDSLAMLSKADVCDILAQASAAVGSTCWKNSPQARAAINAAIELAKSSQPSVDCF
jgi:predicted RecB family nuclease